jgi:hypothetical protein
MLRTAASKPAMTCNIYYCLPLTFKNKKKPQQTTSKSFFQYPLTLLDYKYKKDYTYNPWDVLSKTTMESWSSKLITNPKTIFLHTFLSVQNLPQTIMNQDNHQKTHAWDRRETIFEIIITEEKNLHKNPSEGNNIIIMMTTTRSAAITLTLMRAHSLHSQRSLSQSKSLAKIWSKIHSFQHTIGERERERERIILFQRRWWIRRVQGFLMHPYDHM